MVQRLGVAPAVRLQYAAFFCRPLFGEFARAEPPADEEIPVAEQLHLDAGGAYVAVGVVVKCDFLYSQ